jgi:hypothetical protein
MKLPSDDLKLNVLIAASVCLVTYFFLNRSILLFIPVFALVLFGLWKSGGGQSEAWEDDDPADWWKKGKKWEEH